MKSEVYMYEFIKEKEIEKVILEHMLTAKTLEDKCKELIKRVYDQTISRMLLQAKLHFESNNYYKPLESLYDTLDKLKINYQKYIDSHDPSQIQSVYAQQTLTGVIESITNAIEEFPDDEENPLIYERMLFVSTAILRLKDQINKLEEDVFHEFVLPNSINNDFTKLITQHLLMTCRNLQGPLDILINQATIDFNNIKERPEINKYIGIFKNELVLLGNFIHFDLEIGDAAISKAETERLMIEYIVPLRDFYTQVKKVLDKSNELLKIEFKPEPLEIDNLESIIEGNIFKDVKLKELMEIVEIDKKNTIDMAITYVNDELTKVLKSEIKKLKKISSKFELLSCVVVEIVEMGLEKLGEIQFQAIEDDTERLIAKGVVDTLHLKHEALKEKDAEYHLKKKENYLTFTESFLSFKETFEQNCESFLEASINGSNDGFIRSSERFTKLVSKENEDNLAQDLKYIKEDILFEYATLEDMINQSIQKLQASKNEVAQEFSKIVYQLYNDLGDQLKKQDIIRLLPKVGDTFNGKIHEVVIIDAEEGFHKGEIIRVQNSGFLYGQRILKRAAVIVAK